MNGVDLTKVMGAPAGETFKVTAREMPFARQLSARLVKARNNVLWECEWATGFRDAHSPEVSGPLIHILKNIVVDRLEVPRIEPASDGLMFQLNCPPGRGYRFEAAELTGIANIPQVPKNVRVGIDVRVDIGGREVDPRLGPFLSMPVPPRHTGERHPSPPLMAQAPPSARWQARSQLVFRAAFASDRGSLQPSVQLLNTWRQASFV